MYNDAPIPRPILASRIASSPKTPSVLNFHNPIVHTSSELSTRLLLDRVTTLRTYYGDTEGIYTEAENLIVQTATTGSAVFTQRISDSLQTLAGQLTQIARSQSANNALRIGMDPFAPDTVLSCSQIETAIAQIQIQLNGGGVFDGQPVNTNGLQLQLQSLQQQLNGCVSDNQLVSFLNGQLRDVAHNMVYNFITSTEAAQEGQIALIQKQSRHQGVVNTLANLGGVTGANMSYWVENHIMSKNSTVTQPVSGKESAYAIPINAVQSGGVSLGVLDPATISLLIGLASAIVSLISQAIARSNNPELTDAQKAEIAVQQFGTSGLYRPQDGDWNIDALSAALGSGAILDANGNPIMPGGNDGGGTSPIGSGIDTNTILFGGGALALLFFFLNR